MRLGREVTGEEAVAALKRDQGRKGRADPMGFLFRSGEQATSGSLTTDIVEANSASKTDFSVTAAAEESDRATTRSDKKRHKKSKKRKKHGKKDSNGERRNAGNDGSSSRGGRAGATADSPRVEREKADDSRRIALVRLDDNTARMRPAAGGERLSTPLDDFNV